MNETPSLDSLFRTAEIAGEPRAKTGAAKSDFAQQFLALLFGEMKADAGSKPNLERRSAADARDSQPETSKGSAFASGASLAGLVAVRTAGGENPGLRTSTPPASSRSGPPTLAAAGVRPSLGSPERGVEAGGRAAFRASTVPSPSSAASPPTAEGANRLPSSSGRPGENPVNLAAAKIPLRDGGANPEPSLPAAFEDATGSVGKGRAARRSAGRGSDDRGLPVRGMTESLPKPGGGGARPGDDLQRTTIPRAAPPTRDNPSTAGIPKIHPGPAASAVSGVGTTESAAERSPVVGRATWVSPYQSPAEPYRNESTPPPGSVSPGSGREGVRSRDGFRSEESDEGTLRRPPATEARPFETKPGQDSPSRRGPADPSPLPGREDGVRDSSLQGRPSAGARSAARRGSGPAQARAEGQFAAAPLREMSGLRVQSPEVRTRPAGPSLFNQVLDQLVARARLETSEGLSRFTIQLKPEFLGRMRIETELGRNDGLHALIRVENPAVRKAVEASLPSLIEKLAEAGLKVDTAEVTDLSSGSERWADRKGEQANPRGGKRNEPAPPEESSDEGSPEEGPGDGMISYFA